MVRPGRGDGGLDLVVPVDDERHDVYQVKRFSTNLTNGDKRKIAGSFKRLLETIDNGEIKVRNWYPTMPLDPTPGNRSWLKTLTKDAPFKTEWRGKLFVETLATKHPHVIDHYFGGGRERLADAMKDALRMATGRDLEQGDGLLAPIQAVMTTAQAAQRLADTDPHFRFGISLDPNQPSEESGRDAGCLFMATTYDPGLDMWLCVRVYPRFAEALKFRPVTVHAEFRVEPGSLLANDLAAFEKFGRPFEAPEGSVTMKADLPGGLGGEFTGGALKIFQPDDETRPVRLRLGDEDQNLLAEVEMELRPAMTGHDQTGYFVQGVESADVFEVEILGDATDQTMNMNFRGHDLTGKTAVDVLSGVQFMARFGEAAYVGIAPKYGNQKTSWTQVGKIKAASGERSLYADYVEGLTLVQDLAPFPIRLRNDAETTLREAREVVRLAQLLRGETVNSRQSLTFCGESATFSTDGTFALAGDQEIVFWREGDPAEVPLPRILVYGQKVEAKDVQMEGHSGHSDYEIKPVDGTEWLFSMRPEDLPQVAEALPEP